MKHNDMLELMKTRRSIRAFKPEQIAPEELDAVLEAGTYAPTGRGQQAPTIVAVQDAATREKLVEMNAAVWGRQINPYYGAPTIVLVLTDPERSTCVEDASCVLENMMLAAHAIGLGSCWIHREREMFDSAEGKALLAKWGLPDRLIGVGSIALGYPEGAPPEPKPRKENYIIKI